MIKQNRKLSAVAGLIMLCALLAVIMLTASCAHQGEVSDRTSTESSQGFEPDVISLDKDAHEPEEYRTFLRRISHSSHLLYISTKGGKAMPLEE